MKILPEVKSATVTVNVVAPVLTCAADKSSVMAGESVVFSGSLKAGDVGKAGASIDILNDETVFTSVITDSSGNYRVSVTMPVAGTYSIKARYVW